MSAPKPDGIKTYYARRKERERICEKACEHITTEQLKGQVFEMDPTRSSATFKVYVLKERQS